MTVSLTLKLEQILLRTYGYSHFRPGQLPIIHSLVSGRDVLAILPTGGGKSICFQVPGLYLGGTTLVISPLISLMQDQVDNLVRRGIRATLINSTLEPDEAARRLTAMIAGEYQFVYIAPEKLASGKFMAACRQTRISLVAVDEAHCVSVWGHDFRPSYLRIGGALSQIFDYRPRPPVICLTATANKRAQADIVRFCRLEQPYHVQSSFARDNLYIMIHKCHDEHDKLLHILYLLQKHRGQIGIIYTLTREKAESLAAMINRLLQPEAPVVAYHGGLDKGVRARLQTDFIAGRSPVMVATNAFGMGVDQPHVRFVIHAQISSNLENYFQEIGRGGRDGEPAAAYALYTPHDLEISLQFIKDNHSLSSQRRRVLLSKLKLVARFLKTRQCRQKVVLTSFDENRPGWRCEHCDNCRRQKLTYSPEVKARLTAWQNWRAKIARRYDLIPNTIVTDLTLAYLAIVPWRRLPDMTVIPGIGRGFVERFARFLPSPPRTTTSSGKLDSVEDNNLSNACNFMTTRQEVH